MLTIIEPGNAAGGVSRRRFLRIGCLGLAGLTLPNLLRAESAGSDRRSTKSVIHVFLAGGPSQSEIFPNLDAPDAYRTSFRPSATRVPGLSLCEHMPRIAARADTFVFLPGVHGMDGSHMPHCCFSGAVMSGPGAVNERNEFAAVGGRPSQGAFISRLLGSTDGVVPPYMTLPGLAGDHVGPGFLGRAHGPFQVNEQLLGSLRGGQLANRLEDRRALLRSFDTLRREIDSSGQIEALDRFTQAAIGLVTSSRFANALDLSKEPSRVVDRFRNRGWGSRGFDAGINLQLLRARRLVEAGARYVAVEYPGWDTHQANDEIHRAKLPILDHGLATLVDDLQARGMLDDVLILAWGEMGRSKPYDNPRIDPGTGEFGRGTGHHGECAPAFLAGGGLRAGQMIGALDRHGMVNRTRRVHNHEVLATVYHALGIDVSTVRVFDPNNRPRPLLDHGPIREVI
ncbi:MAG: DUF1501 domain-containing protein [Planctomycetes bacterium]|nr:DUF1501 domain-containing protein [Planctomycetota bacterium]